MTIHMGDDISRQPMPQKPNTNPVWNSYTDGECPDCGDPIPTDVQEGDGCCNCGHVFTEERK